MYEKYVDRVLKHFIRGTKIDDEREVIHFPFSESLRYYIYEYLPQENINDFTGYIGRPLVLKEWIDDFFRYVKNQFGLELEEMEYLYRNYILYIDKKFGYL